MCVHGNGVCLFVIVLRSKNRAAECARTTDVGTERWLVAPPPPLPPRQHAWANGFNVGTRSSAHKGKGLSAACRELCARAMLSLRERCERCVWIRRCPKIANFPLSNTRIDCENACVRCVWGCTHCGACLCVCVREMSVIMASTLVFMACALIRVYIHNTTTQPRALRLCAPVYMCICAKAQVIILSLYTTHKHEHTRYICTNPHGNYTFCTRRSTVIVCSGDTRAFHSYLLAWRPCARPVRNLRE